MKVEIGENLMVTVILVVVILFVTSFLTGIAHADMITQGISYQENVNVCKDPQYFKLRQEADNEVALRGGEVFKDQDTKEWMVIKCTEKIGLKTVVLTSME